MGATTFATEATGDTIEQAFRAAKDYAGYMHGHGGYTGTIAEKYDFTVVQETPLDSDDAYGLVKRLIDSDDPRISDKWGPAGAIPLDTNHSNGEKSWLFFGWAST